MTPSTSSYKSVGGLRRIGKALGYSLQGFQAALKHEAAFRQELLLALVLIPAAFFLGRSSIEIVMLIAPLFLVLAVELINSALEALADAISLEKHPLLGRAKDLGSAAVMLLLLLTALVWLTVAFDRYVH